MAIENAARNIYGFQYHPEVMHTEKGIDMLRHFLLTIAGLKADWTMGQVVEEQMKAIAAKVRNTSLLSPRALWYGLPVAQATCPA